MKRLLLIFILLITALQGFSQTAGISYQAVILNPNAQELPGVDAQGNILANSAVSIQFTIVDASGSEEFQEYHTTSTDRYGMINLLIGNGTATSSNDFTDITWGGSIKKLKVGIDFSGGSNFSPLSEQNLSYMPQPPTQKTTDLILDNTDLISTETTTARAAEAANTAAIVAEAITARTAEQVNATGITTNATGISTLESEQATQNAAIALNTSKIGITPAQATTISNTTGVNKGDQDISGIATNATAISVIETDQITQNSAIGLNTAKEGITPAQATAISNTTGVNTGDQDISGILVNETTVSTLESEQATQNAAIALNTSKTGITPAQASTISNTTGINTGDQDISGILVNETAVSTLETEQTTQNTAIALNTSKTGITPAQATTISNTTGVNKGDQDISGIETNATAISAIESEQTTQDSAIALNTTKVSYPGDQDISGIETNATTISTLESEQTIQGTAIALNTAKVSYPGVTKVTAGKNVTVRGSGTTASPYIVDAAESAAEGTAKGQIQVWDGDASWEVSGSKLGIGNYAGEIDQGEDAIAIGTNAGNDTQGLETVAIGGLAGQSNQSAGAIAIGNNAANSSQGEDAIAIGRDAGEAQELEAIAIGSGAGRGFQGEASISIGSLAGYEQGEGAIAIGGGDDTGYAQMDYSIAIGYSAGYADDEGIGENAIAIGHKAAYGYAADNSIILNASGEDLNASNSGLFIDPISEDGDNEENGNKVLLYNTESKEITYAEPDAAGTALGQILVWSGEDGWIVSGSNLGIGNDAGKINQGVGAIAIGDNAANSSQGQGAIAIGRDSGAVEEEISQGVYAIAIGETSGRGQGSRAIAIGQNAGVRQGEGAIAIGSDDTGYEGNEGSISLGYGAGYDGVGDYSVVIGYNAGYEGVSDNTIILNATGEEFNDNGNGLYIDPISEDGDNEGNGDKVLLYNTESKEITYAEPDAAGETNAAAILEVETRITALEPTTPIVGDYVEGGVVFWVNPADKTKGLVCAIEDQAPVGMYGCNAILIEGANGVAIGTGKLNTIAILNKGCPVETTIVAENSGLYSVNVAGVTYNDWFVPSADELKEIYNNKAAINSTAGENGGTDLVTNWYWSSTQVDMDNAWIQYFGQAEGNSASKRTDGAVRSVRAYSIVSASIDTNSADIALKANIASPTFTGTPLAPTATKGDSSTAIATTAFVTNAVSTATTGNFVDLTTDQTIAGNKSFSSDGRFNELTIGRGSGNNATNTVVGRLALANNTSGSENVAIGLEALHRNTTGNANTVVGLGAVYYATSSSAITAFGKSALHAEQGSGNTAIGHEAAARGAVSATLTNSTFLGRNATASNGTIDNATAIGSGATVNASNTIQLGNTSVTNVKTSGTLTAGTVTYPNAHGTANQVLKTDGLGTLAWSTPSSGATNINGLSDALVESSSIYLGKDPSGTTDNANYNVSVGISALNFITTGNNNVAVGFQSLYANTGGYSNTAIGDNVMRFNIDGFRNTAIGTYSLYRNTAGQNNVSNGGYSLHNNTTGSNSSAFGYKALYNSTGSGNTGLGYQAGDVITTGTNNVIIGKDADPTDDSAINQIVIGYNATGAGDDTVQLGNTSVTNVKTSGTITAGTVTYPNAHGLANQVLKTNGSGTLSWATSSTPTFIYGTSNTLIDGTASVGSTLTTGDLNSAYGYLALSKITTGQMNTASGAEALYSNDAGSYNTASGETSMRSNTDGSFNTASGYAALYSNSSGYHNIAIGGASLFQNTTGSKNSANGYQTLRFNDDGNENSTQGYQSLYYNTSGSKNVALGYRSGWTNTTGSNNTLIGSSADVLTHNLTNATAIGYNASVAASNTIQLGNTSVNNVKTSGTITAGTVTYPNADGTANQVLKTDGLGAASWGSAAATVREVADEFTSTGGETSFILAQTPSDNSMVKMYINGIRISNTAYTWSGTTLTYIPANNGSYDLTASDRVQFDFYY